MPDVLFGTILGVILAIAVSIWLREILRERRQKRESEALVEFVVQQIQMTISTLGINCEGAPEKLPRTEEEIRSCLKRGRELPGEENNLVLFWLIRQTLKARALEIECTTQKEEALDNTAESLYVHQRGQLDAVMITELVSQRRDAHNAVDWAWRAFNDLHSALSEMGFSTLWPNHVEYLLLK